MIFTQILNELKEIKAIHEALPTWLPLTKEYAKECGYSLDGLRKKCLRLSPDKFEKRGGKWFVHVSALHLLKRKVL